MIALEAISAVQLPVQLPTSAPGKAAESRASAWAPTVCLGCLDELLASV